MTLSIINSLKQTLTLPVKKLALHHNILSLGVGSEQEAQGMFDSLKSLGIRCCKTSKNSPDGPGVCLWSYQDCFTIQIN